MRRSSTRRYNLQSQSQRRCARRPLHFRVHRCQPAVGIGSALTRGRDGGHVARWTNDRLGHLIAPIVEIDRPARQPATQVLWGYRDARGTLDERKRHGIGKALIDVHQAISVIEGVQHVKTGHAPGTAEPAHLGD